MAVLSRVLQIWLSWILARPRTVLVMAFLTAVISIVLAANRLDLQTDQLELISAEHPLIALSDRLAHFRLGGKATFTVAVMAPTPERGVQFASALAALVEQDSKHFRGVLYRVDPNLLKSWALLYPDVEDIGQIRTAVTEHARLIEGVADQPDLIALLRLINQEMTRRMVGELFTGFLEESDSGANAAGTKEPMDLGFLIQTLEGLRDGLQGSESFRSPWFSFFKNNFFDLSLEGYFWEGGKRYLLMFVAPEKHGDGFETIQASIQQLRLLITELQRTYPDVQAGVTGQQALNNDQMMAAMNDMSRATWWSLAGILVLMVVFLNGMRRPLIGLVSLGVGLCWTLGWTTLVIGHLNILSVVFRPFTLRLGRGLRYSLVRSLRGAGATSGHRSSRGNRVGEPAFGAGDLSGGAGYHLFLSPAGAYRLQRVDGTGSHCRFRHSAHSGSGFYRTSGAQRLPRWAFLANSPLRACGCRP